MNIKPSISCLILGLGLASAHLGTLSSPKAGASFKAGDKVNITWTIDTPHDGIDLALSTNGSTWTLIKQNLPLSTKTFTWNVPNTPSGTARIRVCQKDGATGCTDAQNASSPQDAIAAGGGSVYTLVSGNFSITPSSSTAREAPPLEAISLRAHPELQSVDVALGLRSDERIRLLAYDMRGKLSAVLVDAWKPAGTYEFSVFSGTLQASRPLVLKLQVGDQTLTQAWPALP
jgi:hypothetical protein